MAKRDERVVGSPQPESDTTLPPVEGAAQRIVGDPRQVVTLLDELREKCYVEKTLSENDLKQYLKVLATILNRSEWHNLETPPFETYQMFLNAVPDTAPARGKGRTIHKHHLAHYEYLVLAASFRGITTGLIRHTEDQYDFERVFDIHDKLIAAVAGEFESNTRSGAQLLKIVTAFEHPLILGPFDDLIQALVLADHTPDPSLEAWMERSTQVTQAWRLLSRAIEKKLPANDTFRRVSQPIEILILLAQSIIEVQPYVTLNDDRYIEAVTKETLSFTQRATDLDRDVRAHLRELLSNDLPPHLRRLLLATRDHPLRMAKLLEAHRSMVSTQITDRGMTPTERNRFPFNRLLPPSTDASRFFAEQAPPNPEVLEQHVALLREPYSNDCEVVHVAAHGLMGAVVYRPSFSEDKPARDASDQEKTQFATNMLDEVRRLIAAGELPEEVIGSNLGTGIMISDQLETHGVAVLIARKEFASESSTTTFLRAQIPPQSRERTLDRIGSTARACIDLMARVSTGIKPAGVRVSFENSTPETAFISNFFLKPSGEGVRVQINFDPSVSAGAHAALSPVEFVISGLGRMGRFSLASEALPTDIRELLKYYAVRVFETLCCQEFNEERFEVFERVEGALLGSPIATTRPARLVFVGLRGNEGKQGRFTNESDTNFQEYQRDELGNLNPLTLAQVNAQHRAAHPDETRWLTFRQAHDVENDTSTELHMTIEELGLV